MRVLGPIKKRTIVLPVLLSLLLTTAAESQNRQRSRGHSGKEILVLNPTAADAADAEYVVVLGDRVRNRMDFRFRRRIDTFQTRRICEAMTASGFECNAHLDDVMVGQMADFLNADAYFLWDLRRVNGAPTSTIHMIDTGRSGVSGWTTVVGEPNQSARDFADVVLDSLAPQMAAAQEARRCYSERDNQNYRTASERAYRAFREYPNHPSAAVCLSTVFEADDAPLDSVIMALEKTVAGDSLIPRMWQRLGQSYLLRGDSLAAADAFLKQVEANPNDMDQRFGVAIMYRRQQQYQKALDLVDYAVQRNPTDMIGLNMKTEICTEAEWWGCVLETLALVYEADSTTHAESEFYQQIFAAAQSEADTVAMLHWSGMAVENLPESLVLWRARAQALRDDGQDRSALAAYRKIAQLDTLDIRSTLNAAQIVLSWIVVDSVTPLDSGAIALADTLLQETASRNAEVSINVAAEYLRKVGAFAQGGHPALAVEWAEKTLALSGDNDRLITQANFWLGLSLYGQVALLDGAVMDTESCQAVADLEATWNRAVDALTAGRSVHEPTAQRYLDIYGQWRERIPQLRAAFCQ